MIITKKIFLSGLMAAFLICRAHKEELSTRQKAAAGTSFVTAGIFSGYLAYARNQTDSWLTTTLNLFFSAPFAAVGGTMLTEALAEIADQNLINEAYGAHCLAMRRYKNVIDRWNSGHSAFADLAPLITIPIDSYLFSLKKTIDTLHDQEDALKIRLLSTCDNMHTQKLFKQLLHGIIETHTILDKIYAVLNANTIYFVENLGEDSMLEEAAAAADETAAITESSEIAQEIQYAPSEVIALEQANVVIEPAPEYLQEAVTDVDDATLSDNTAEVVIQIAVTLPESQEENDESGDTIPWSELTPVPSQNIAIEWSELTPTAEAVE